VSSSSPDLHLLVIGGGNMGSALVSGLVSSGWAPEHVAVVEPLAERRTELAMAHERLVVRATSDGVSIDETGGAVLAVKQEAAAAACRAAASAGARRVLSIVAGLSCELLEGWLPAGTPMVRAVPNTPALVGSAVSVISGGSHATAPDLDWAEQVLGSVGTVLRLPERHLDAVTGLSGSGPAYLFLVAEALIDAGVSAGLPREVAERLVVQTVQGSGALLGARGGDPGALRAMVTSPGGTTAAGLRVLEARAVRSAFLEAVVSATERSRQLGHLRS
jgi:pyrroline-5-carboxylate reductase